MRQAVFAIPVGLARSCAENLWRWAATRLAVFEFAELSPADDEPARKALIGAKVFLVYQRQLNNLSIQEGRLRRHCEKDTATLGQLQQDRADPAKKLLNEAARQYIAAVHESRPFEPAELGLELSVAQIEIRAIDIDPDLFAAYEAEQPKKAA